MLTSAPREKGSPMVFDFISHYKNSSYTMNIEMGIELTKKFTDFVGTMTRCKMLSYRDTLKLKQVFAFYIYDCLGWPQIDDRYNNINDSSTI